MLRVSIAGDLLGVALEEVGDPVEDGAPLRSRRLRPLPGVEGATRGADRPLDVGVRGDVDPLDLAAVERRDDGARLARTSRRSIRRR